MKNLSDILRSLYAQERPFSAETMTGNLKIMMQDGNEEIAYIPNQMTDKVFDAYHLILNIPLPVAENKAVAAASKSDMDSTEDEHIETVEEYLASLDDSEEEEICNNDEGAFYEDCDGRIQINF